MFGVAPERPVSHAARGLLLATTIILVSGCASTGTRSTGSSEQLAERERSRAERIFLYQSRVADQLLNRYPLLEVFEDADPELIAAEAHMTESCSPLTRAVLTKLEGNEPSLGLRLKVFTSLNACERAAERMDRMLQQSSRSQSI